MNNSSNAKKKTIFAFLIIVGFFLNVDLNISEGKNQDPDWIATWQSERLNAGGIRYFTAYDQTFNEATFDRRDHWPSIDGYNMVITSERDTTWRIYHYNILNNALTPITNNITDQRNASISGNNVVYTDYSTGWGDILLYNLVTGATQIITSVPFHNEQSPQIDGDHIVWMDERNINTSLLDIYHYNLQTGVESIISDKPGSEIYPDISGEWVVYLYGTGVGTPNVYLYNLANGLERQISTSNLNKAFPRVSKSGYAVWSEQQSSGSYAVLLYDINLGQLSILENNIFHSNIDIAGENVVYAKFRNGQIHLIVENIVTGEKTLLTEGDNRLNIYPTITTFD